MRKVLLSDFRKGYVTGLLLALPVVQALMDDGMVPRNLAPHESQLSCEQTVGLNRLLIAAKSHLRPLPIERRQDLGRRRNLTTGRMEIETAL